MRIKCKYLPEKLTRKGGGWDPGQFLIKVILTGRPVLGLLMG